VYRHVDALLVRGSVLRPADLPGRWPDMADPGSWRPWLQLVMAIPQFAEAVQVASPSVCGQVERMCHGTAVSERDARRLVLAVMRYALRASSRATPFGLFAGSSFARLGGALPMRLGRKHEPIVRVDAQWVAGLVARLEADPRLQSHLKVQANSLLIERGGQFILANRVNAILGGAPVDATVAATRPVRAALAHAQDPVPVSVLIDKLAAELDVDDDRIQNLLTQMIRERLLVTSLRPPMTAPDPLGWIATALHNVATAAGEDPAAETSTLSAVRTLIERGATGATMAGTAGDRRRRVESMLNAVSGQTPETRIDLRLDWSATVAPVVAAEAASAANALVRLAPVRLDGWARWHRSFLDRYGPGALVPLLDVTDPDTGLGFPPGFHGAPPLTLPGVTDRDHLLLDLAHHACLIGEREIVLDEPLIHALADQTAAVGGIQPSAELTVRVHAPNLAAIERGEFELSLVRVSRTAGTTTGRVLDLLSEGQRDRFTSCYQEVPTGTQGALAVQVSAVTPHVSTENVARAPRILPHVIPVGEYCEPGATTIPLTELGVTATVSSLHLIWMPHRRVVEPKVFNAVEPVNHTLPLVRFLTELPAALSTLCAPFDWGAAAELPYLPALRHGRTYLTRPRWRLSASRFPDSSTSQHDWAAALASWRELAGCPAVVYLGEGDQRFRIDLAEPAHQALLRDYLTRQEQAMLRAAEDPESRGWIGGYAHEVVIPVVTDAPPGPPPHLPATTVPTAVREHGHLPGDGDRIYLKLYGHADRQHLVLTRHLPRLLERLDSDRWWFLRYRDPEPHLRLRLTGSTDLGAVADWVRAVRSDGLISRMQLDTDFPETARFGGTDGLAAAERVFAADSAAALAQLAFAGRNGVQLSAVIAASVLDLAVAFFCDSDAGMRWLVEHTRAHRTAPERALYRQAVDLANPHDRSTLTGLGADQVLRTWTVRADALASYRDTLIGSGWPDPARLLPDLLHLHHTRIAGADIEDERACLHLARAAALSWSSRARSR
jgi:thiopeptide-type bacteriocin biosynthesis protein